jgi:hypothetical protein
MPKEIKSFKTERYSFLSNMYPCKIVYDGLTFQNSEAAYQAAKCRDAEDKLRFVSLNGYQAKYLAKTIPTKIGWHNTKIDTMREIIQSKFSQNPDLQEKLLETEDAYLIEGNTWGDTFWGMCGGKGENHLGKILMEVRESLQKEQYEIFEK